MGIKQDRRRIVHRFYNHFAKDYDKSRYGAKEQKVTAKITKEVVSELFGDVKNKLFLDCGCGTGRFLEFFTKKGSRVIGVDISENMLKIAKKKIPNVNLSRADIFSLPFKNKVFDIILCSQVLTHLHNYKAPLLEMGRVLKDRGIIIIDIRNILWPRRLSEALIKRVIRKSSEEYSPDYISIWGIKKICSEIDLAIDEFRGTGLSIKISGAERMRKEIKRSDSNLKYIAPTLLLKIVKR